MYVEGSRQIVFWDITEFAWRDGGKPRKIAVSIAGLWAEILIRDFSNTEEES
jgi:hypothetical protein